MWLWWWYIGGGGGDFELCGGRGHVVVVAFVDVMNDIVGAGGDGSGSVGKRNIRKNALTNI